MKRAALSLSEQVQKTAHIAYQVSSMDESLKGAKILYGPFTPVIGMDVAFIEEEGIPIELDYFFADKNKNTMKRRVTIKTK